MGVVSNQICFGAPRDALRPSLPSCKASRSTIRRASTHLDENDTSPLEVLLIDPSRKDDTRLPQPTAAMTGGGFIPTASAAEEYELDEQGGEAERHAVQWVGKAGVKGPRWARMPLLTVGMLGVQVSGVSICSFRE